MTTVCGSANVTAESLAAAHIDEARPHVRQVRGMTVDEAQRYGIEHGLDGRVLFVACALASEVDRVVQA